MQTLENKETSWTRTGDDKCKFSWQRVHALYSRPSAVFECAALLQHRETSTVYLSVKQEEKMVPHVEVIRKKETRVNRLVKA